jgi:hypothetical protein
LTQNHYCIGIPIINININKLDLLIGHYFSKNYEKLHTFVYSLKEKSSVKLPTFSFDVLVISENGNDAFTFGINGIINIDNKFKDYKKFPKFISLCSNKSEYEQILLKQRVTRIEVQSLDKHSSTNGFKCSFFIPFDRYLLLYFVGFLL